jgi:tetratricopeptide (TPR) repeat protein
LRSCQSAALNDEAKKYFEQGNKNYDLCQFKEEIADYTKAIDLDPENEEAYNDRGLLFLIQSQQKQAYQDIQQATLDNSFFSAIPNSAKFLLPTIYFLHIKSHRKQRAKITLQKVD